MSQLPKVKYWSSSPLAPVTTDPASLVRSHAVLMTVKSGDKPEQTVRIATCINGAVSKRIAEILDKEEGVK